MAARLAPSSARLKIGLVGGGKAGAALLDLLQDWPLGQVVVVVDPRPDAPARRRAETLDIPTASHHLEAFAYPADVVLEATGLPAVLDDLLHAKPPHVDIIGAGGLRFFWALLQSHVKAARQLTVRLEMALAFGAAAGPRQQIAIVAQKLADACGVDRCTLFLLDEATGLVAPVTSQFATGLRDGRMWEIFNGLGPSTPADLPFFHEVSERQAPIEIAEPASSPLLPAGWAELFEIKSLLVLPIFRKDRVIGACLLDYCQEPRPFTPEQASLALSLTTQLSLALENTRLYQRAEERAEKLKTLSTLTQLIISARDVQQVFVEVAKAATTLLGGRLAHVWVDDPAQGVVRIQSGFGLDPSVEAELLEFREVPHGEGLIASTFESRAPTYAADVQHDPRWLNKRLAKELGLHAYAAIPLVTGDHVAGALAILFDRPRVFTPEEKELMTLLAGQAAVAITNARLLEETERRHRAATGLAETGRLITQSLDSEEIARRIADSLRALLGGRYAALFKAKADSEDLVTVAVSGDDGPTFGPNMVLPEGTGVAGVAVRERRAVATRDVLSDPRIVYPPDIRERIAHGRCLAGLGVPVIVQDRVIGALTVRDLTGRHWSREEIELAHALADQAAVALENARLYGEATRRQRQARELARLAQVVTASLDLPDVLERVARAATDLLPDSASSIWVVEGDRLKLRSEAGSHHRPRSGAKTEFAFGEGLTGHVAAAREPLVVEDVLADPRTVNVAWMRHEGYASLLSIPLLVRDRFVGVLSLLTRHRHHFGPEELDSLTSFGNQAAIAIENAMLLQEGRTREGRLQTLLQVSCELSRIQPLQSLLGCIAEACGRLVQADFAGFRLVEGDEMVIAGTWGDGDDALLTSQLKVGESLSGIVAARGESLVVRDPADDPRLNPARQEAWRQLGYRTFLGVPAKVGDRVVGVLTVLTRREDAFSSGDLTIASAFASQAAVALENSRLLQETQRAYDELTHTQDQLTQAQKMEAVGRLAGGIAHDFNNLLTVIMGRTELLLHPLKPEDPLHRSIDLIRKTAGRAAELTRQLLAFSRKQVLQPRALCLNIVVSHMEQMLRRVIGEDIALVTVLDPSLGHVKADPGQIDQVIMNLAVNARDAMPHGGQLTIETANVELDAAYARRHVGASPGPHVMLAMSDTGIGMEREVQSHIFEPFFTTKEPGKGTGLGLATVYGIVKQSGGHVWVYSEPGRGAAFKIYLPRIDEALESEERSTAKAQSPRGTETILLVEDEEEVRELTRDILRANGYTVLDAARGEEAFLTCERHPGPIHLLLTDVVMPQMSGRELAERLMRPRADMKVLYISGYTDDAVVRHGVLESATAFLQKPFTPDTLTRKVREVLDASPSPNGAGPPALHGASR